MRGAFGVGAGDLVGTLGYFELHIGAHTLQEIRERHSCNLFILFVVDFVFVVVAAATN